MPRWAKHGCASVRSPVAGRAEIDLTGAMTVSEVERLHEGLAPVGGTPSRTPTIEVDELVKRFDTLEAVRGISFDVAAGETFGFLGPNGAGKTTTIQVLCTLAHPSSGSARIAGLDVVRDSLRVRAQIGLVFQDTTLDDYLTAEENLRFHAQLYRVPRAAIAQRLSSVLEMGRARGAPPQPRTHVLGRDEAPAGDRPRAAAFPPCALPRRADGRAGPAYARAHLDLHRGAAPPRADHDLPHHPLHGGGRALQLAIVAIIGATALGLAVLEFRVTE